MRRFSQRNALVTLSDINLTPLLDLAWTLLIIFMITTPFLTRGIDLKLPEGGRPPVEVNRNDLQTVEIDQTGQYFLNRQPMDLDSLEQQLVTFHQNNPNLVVRIRADKQGAVDPFVRVIDRLTEHGITRISIATEPGGRR
ncbi:MAG: biopolymer transporter ExbD [Verrucomicrobiales bacterium]|nr:biopolymer transporter ExbD [Verrucomicrobiales bacterium]